MSDRKRKGTNESLWERVFVEIDGQRFSLASLASPNLRCQVLLDGSPGRSEPRTETPEERAAGLRRGSKEEALVNLIASALESGQATGFSLHLNRLGGHGTGELRTELRVSDRKGASSSDAIAHNGEVAGAFLTITALGVGVLCACGGTLARELLKESPVSGLAASESRSVEGLGPEALAEPPGGRSPPRGAAPLGDAVARAEATGDWPQGIPDWVDLPSPGDSGRSNSTREGPKRDGAEARSSRIEFRGREEAIRELIGRQGGRCAVTGDPLNETLILHHVVPAGHGGVRNADTARFVSDPYRNGVLVNDELELDHGRGRDGAAPHIHAHGGNFATGAFAPFSFFPHSHGGDLEAHREWASAGEEFVGRCVFPDRVDGPDEPEL